jgi:hypothetical protein
VPEAVGCARFPIAILLEVGAIQQAVEQLYVVAGEYLVGWLRQLRGRWRGRRGSCLLAPGFAPEERLLRPVEQTLIGMDRSRGALAIANPTL